MHRSIIALATVLCVLLACCSTRAMAAEARVKAELLSETQAIKPGEPFTVGVLLQMEAGWHIYWTNPGEGGLPTEVKWTLPPGFIADPMQFPAPERIEVGGVVNYGYTDTVMLTATIHPPATATAGDAAIAAKVTWLVCKDMCMPGKASLSISLPIAAAAAPANREVFAQWAARMPVAGDTKDSPVTVAASGVLSADHSPASFTVRLHWKNADAIPQNVLFCPEAAPSLDVKDIRIDTTGPETTLKFTAAAREGAVSEPTTLAGVLTYPDAVGHLRGIAVNVPLQAGK